MTMHISVPSNMEFLDPLKLSDAQTTSCTTELL
jgi:hypothetical protein